MGLNRPLFMSTSTNREQAMDVTQTLDIITNQENLSDNASETTETLNPHSKRAIKRTKKSDVVATIGEQLQPIKSILEKEPEKYAVNFLQLQSFFENTIGVNEIGIVALEITPVLESLVETLQMLYPHYTDRNIRNRSTRLKKKNYLLLLVN